MKKRTVLCAAVSLALMLVATHADTIVLDSGKSITGEIVEENLDEIVVKLPSGVTTTVSRDNIVEIKREEDLEKEYQKRLARIGPGNTYAMLELAEWCRQRGLKKHQREMLKAILDIYPDDPDAKRELDILAGKLPESARQEKKDSESITFAPGAGGGRKKEKAAKDAAKGRKETGKAGLKELKKERITRKIWADGKKVNCRPSKCKPKGSTAAGLKGLDWLLEHGTRVRWGPQGQVVTDAFAGFACLSSRDNKYAGLLDRCVNAVKRRVKRYLTGKRQEKPGNQCNWALSIGGMFLAEALPYYDSEEYRGILQKICDQLIINMEETGGWGHDAGGPNSLGYVELEIMSNFAVACMGMCKREGFSVPKAKLAKAVAYIEKCVSGRGVGYSHSNRWGHVSRSGGAVFALSMARAKKGKYGIVCTQVDRMMQHVRTGHSSPALSFLQCAIGSLQIGRSTWDKYVATWFRTILKHQNEDGSFKMIKNPKENIMFEEDLGPGYTTSIYSFILLVDRGNLKYTSGCARGK